MLSLGQKLFIIGLILNIIVVLSLLLFRKPILSRTMALILIIAFMILMVGGLVIHIMKEKEKQEYMYEVEVK